MRCPRCAIGMQGEPICTSCPKCGGTFFSLKQAQEYFGIDLKSEETAGEDPIEHASWEDSVACPDCCHTMVRVDAAAKLQLDHCPHCVGFFFDGGESLALKAEIIEGVSGPTLRHRIKRLVAKIALPRGPYR